MKTLREEIAWYKACRHPGDHDRGTRLEAFLETVTPQMLVRDLPQGIVASKDARKALVDAAGGEGSTLEDLAKIPRPVLQKYRNVGLTTLHRTEEVLEEAGLPLYGQLSETSLGSKRYSGIRRHVSTSIELCEKLVEDATRTLEEIPPVLEDLKRAQDKLDNPAAINVKEKI